MAENDSLNKAIQRIVEAVNPERVILFGSRARDEADADSDLDLMVIEKQTSGSYEEMIRLRKAVGNVGVGVDILVYSKAEFERRSQVPGTVLYWARREGRILYEAKH